MKFAIVVQNTNHFMVKYNENIINELLKLRKIELFIILDSKESGKYKNSRIKKIYIENQNYLHETFHPKYFEVIFEKLNQININKVFIPRLINPEFLYNELIYKKNKIQIQFSTFGMELFLKSDSRKALMFKLINLINVKKVLIHTIENLKNENEFELNKYFTSNKIFFTNDLVYENPKSYNLDQNKIKKQMKIADNKVTFLFFGNPFYGKGIDLIFSSSKKFNKNVTILIASNLNKANFDLKTVRNKNLIILDSSFNDKEMFKLFAAVDFVLLPYRDTYIHGTSGVFIQSMLARKPVILPNFSPFSKIIKKYKVGLSFKPQDANDLSVKINGLLQKDNYNKFVLEIDRYCKNELVTWKEIADILTTH